MKTTGKQGTGADPQRATQPDFAVVTYNILADAYVRPQRYPNSPPQALDRDQRRQRLLDRVASLDADIYCLQEVEQAAFEHIGDRLGAGYHAGYEQKRGRPDGSAMFVRNAAFTTERMDAIHFEAHDPGDDQLALIAHVRAAGGQQLAIASTHLRWQPPRTRREDHLGRRQLIELLHRRRADDPALRTWLIAGDFNAISESVVLQAAQERGFKLACRAQRPWDTCNINGRCRKLDYVLYEPEALIPEPGTLPRLDRNTPMPSLTEPSDHLAVWVGFRFAARS